MGRISLVRNGIVEVSAGEFQTCASKIYIYKYIKKQRYELESGQSKMCIRNITRGMINIPKSICDALNLRHMDRIEVAIRKLQKGK